MCYDEKMKIGNATYCFYNPCKLNIYKICNGNNFKNTLVDFIGNIKVKNNTPDGIYPINLSSEPQQMSPIEPHLGAEKGL